MRSTINSFLFFVAKHINTGKPSTDGYSIASCKKTFKRMLDCIRELRYVSQKMISVPQVPKISGKELYSLFHAPIPVYRQFILRYQPLIRYFLIFRHIGHGVHAAGAFLFSCSFVCSLIFFTDIRAVICLFVYSYGSIYI